MAGFPGMHKLSKRDKLGKFVKMYKKPKPLVVRECKICKSPFDKPAGEGSGSGMHRVVICPNCRDTYKTYGLYQKSLPQVLYAHRSYWKTLQKQKKQSWRHWSAKEVDAGVNK